MYLNQLETVQKFAFLNIAHFMALADGDYRSQENKMVKNYCLEMGISELPFDDDNFDLETELAKFSTPKSRKILILELMFLVHIDDRFDLFEHKAMAKIGAYFNIDDKILDLFSQWGKAQSALYKQGELFISNRNL